MSQLPPSTQSTPIPVDSPPILCHVHFLEFVRQSLCGMVINCLQHIKQSTGVSLNEAIKRFLSEARRDQTIDFVTQSLQEYTTRLCDDYCTSYAHIFRDRKYDLNTALNVKTDADSYAFQTFNQFFEESRRAEAKLIPALAASRTHEETNVSTKEVGQPAATDDTSSSTSTVSETAPPALPPAAVPGPLHLGCLIQCLLYELAPKLIPLLLASLHAANISMVSMLPEPARTLDDGQRQAIRIIVNQHIADAFQRMRTDPELLSAAREMKFVCQPPPSSDLDSHSPCDQGWDWHVCPEAKQAEVRRVEKQMWQQYREDIKNGVIVLPNKNGGSSAQDEESVVVDEESEESEDDEPQPVKRKPKFPKKNRKPRKS